MAFLRIQIENIASFFGPDEVDEIWITFPDPHLRERDDQKRLTSHRFLNLYRQFLKPNGFVNLKTDSRFLYDFTLEVIQDQNLPIKIQTEHLYQSEYADDVLSIKTTYEKIWLKEGLNICYLKFTL